MTSATVAVSVEGRTYDIPEAWLVGATRILRTTEAATRHWHDQVILEESAFKLMSDMVSRKLKRERNRAAKQLDATRKEIERNSCAVSDRLLSVKLADNAFHFYYETPKYCVLRNHGSAYWTGFVKDKGIYSVVKSSPDPITVVNSTEAAATELANARAR